MICDALIIISHTISSDVIYVHDVASYLSQPKLTKWLMKLQLLCEHMLFESANIFCCCSSMRVQYSFIYNCTSITDVSKDKTNAEKERERYESISSTCIHSIIKHYTRSFLLKHTGVIQVKCQVFPKGSLHRELNFRSAMSSCSSKLLRLRQELLIWLFFGPLFH